MIIQRTFNLVILYHNGELLTNGRNYQTNTSTFAGLPLDCIGCRRRTDDHFANHHVVHLHCDMCLFETKTAEDIYFWKKVCSICGKKFDSERLKEIHRKKHDFPKEQCHYCGQVFSTKYNFQRHLIEKHNTFQNTNNGPFDGIAEDEEYKFTCNLCQKEFKYERNVVAHIETVHHRSTECKCGLCGKILTRKSNLKVHLAEQHGILDVDRELKRDHHKKYTCNVCGKEFYRKSHLDEHKETHEAVRQRYSCCFCQKSFSSTSHLRRHKNIHLQESTNFECNICQRSFNSQHLLSKHFNIHSDDRKVFQCDQCLKEFLAQTSLNRHIKEKH